MSSIVIDGLNEEDFRREIEVAMRHGRELEAIARLRKLLQPYAGPAGILPERFLTVSAEELSLRGWDYLGDCIVRHDRPGRPVTALSVAFGWPGEDAPGPDENGCLHPHIETGYFNDAAYPFSQSGRDDLLDGYSLHGCTWSADCEASDNALSLDGVDDLSGALASLETRLMATDEPDPDEIAAGSMGACLLSILLFQAVGQKIAKDGLPRPLCVTAGSSGVYPYFDAPVVGMPDHVRKAAAEAEEEDELVDAGVPGPRYSSLLMTGIPRAQKRAVLVLAETEQEAAVRIARLRSHGEDGGDAGEAPALAPEPDLPQPLPDQPLPTALPGGLLKTKVPHGPAWDFRDMLSPRSAEPPAPAPRAEPEPRLPEVPPVLRDFESEPAAREMEPEPAARDLEPEPEVPANLASEPKSESEPGFPLLADSLQDRLESLLAPQKPVAEPPRPIAQPWAPEQAGPVWPFALIDDAGPESPEPAPLEAALQEQSQPSAPGLWARLRAWVFRSPKA